MRRMYLIPAGAILVSAVWIAVTGFVIVPVSWFASRNSAYAFAALYFLWLIFETYNFARGREGAVDKDHGTLWIVFAGVLFSAAAIICLRFFLGPWPHIQDMGMLIMIAGIALRQWAVLSLGKNFSVKVKMTEKNTLVRSGPYRWIRHPSYTGVIMIFTGIGLMIGTPIGAAVSVAAILAGLSRRIEIEEKEMLSAFGNEYKDYRSRTWKLFPGW